MLCVCHDYFFLVQVLLIFVNTFLQLSFVNKVRYLFFLISVSQLKATAFCVISFYQLLDLFFKRKHTEKTVKTTWFDVINGRLVFFSYFWKHYLYSKWSFRMEQKSFFDCCYCADRKFTCFTVSFEMVFGYWNC